MPLGRHPVDVVTDDLISVYQGGSRRLEALVRDALTRGLDPARAGGPDAKRGDASAAYRRRAFMQSQAILGELRANIARTAPLAVGRAYSAGLFAVDATLMGDAANVVGGFGGQHHRAIEVLAGNMTRSLQASVDRTGDNLADVFDRAAALDGPLKPSSALGSFVGRRVDDPWRKIGLDETAQGLVSLATRRQVSSAMVNRLVREGVSDALTGFVDKRGARWNLATYAETVARTTTREAVSRATVNRLTENGHDLVTVSSHPHTADECTPYDGQTFSLSGDDDRYPELDSMPPFHPRCLHVLMPSTTTLDDYERELGLAAGNQAGAAPAPTVRRRPAPAPRPTPAAPPVAPPPAPPRAAPVVPRSAGPVPGTRDVASTLNGPRSGTLKPIMDRVTAAIGRVHGVPAHMPTIPVKRSTARQSVGKFRYMSNGTPLDIRVSTNSSHQHLTLTHEVGHFLDLAALPGQQYATTGAAAYPEVADLLNALRGSRAFAELGEWAITSGNKRYAKYARSNVELFARGYAQYIAQRSGDPVLLAELADERVKNIAGKRPMQWAEDDFAPIAEAFDRLFAKHGMREQT